MKASVNLNKIYKPSEDVVAREVQGEFLMIPITSGVGDMEDGIFTLNETARAVWNNLDSRKTLKDVAGALASEFEGPVKQIEKDVMGILEELLKRKMVVEIK